MSAPTMDVILFRQIGLALHGRNWQAPLAQHLGVSSRTIARWSAGETPIPAPVCRTLDRLLVTQRNFINGLLLDLRRLERERLDFARRQD